MGGRNKRLYFGKKRLKTDQKIAKKKTLADQFLRIFREKKQTTPDQVELKKQMQNQTQTMTILMRILHKVHHINDSELIYNSNDNTSYYTPH